MMDALLGAAHWKVDKALALLADGLMEAWEARNNLGLNIEALKMELLLVKAALETARHKQICGQAMEELLGKLRHSLQYACNLLADLDHFRIHEQLHDTSDAADHHGNPHPRLTSKTVGKLACLPACCDGEPGQVQDINCCAWPRAQRVGSNFSSAPNVNLDDGKISRCMFKLSKLLPCFSLLNVHGDDETPKQGFSRVDMSERLKTIVEQLQPVRIQVTKILQSCDRITFPHVVQSRPMSTSLSVEPVLYGRNDIMNSIIHDMTQGQYCDKRLTVLPVIGPGGIGKTTLIQHIYNNKQVQNHFPVRIWICVSLNFNLGKVLEEIKACSPRVEAEKVGSTTEELIEQRLKHKRFLLVLDDVWQFGNGDDWKLLLSMLHQSQEKGCMILVTTRFQAIAQKVKTTAHSIELSGLESEEFSKLFLGFVFDDEECRIDHMFLLEIGNKIMEKLKGSPLAAKTVGRLLRNNLNLDHWLRVLESKEWEMQSSSHDIMPALKLSYDHLPFHLQQCFFYSALFPEDFHFSSCQLINLWIGLDILQPGAQRQTFEDILGIGLSNLKVLVKHGFFTEEKTNGRPCYVMHDLLHDLALKVASQECLTLHYFDATSVEIYPSIRHLSIIVSTSDDNALSLEIFKTEMRKLKARLYISQLQTLMIFGEMDESFAKVFGDLFGQANALRVLHFPEMSYPVEYILHNFSTLVHLRYLFLGTKDRGLLHRVLCPGTGNESQIHLPLAISRFYDLRILDLGSWYGRCDLPKDMSNLTKLCRFYTQKDELHSAICNVGKLKYLEELKVFRVNRENEGFEPKQLAHLTELSELGIYNLENIHTEEEGAEAKLSEKNYLEKLTLDWDSKRSNIEPDVEAVVLESLKPHTYLQELCIRGHGGPCPTWLGDDLVVKALQSLSLIGVSWEVLPSVGEMWDLRKLVLKHIATVKQFDIEQSFCRLTWFELVGLESFEKWIPSWETPMVPLLQVLIIRDCPKLLELPFSNHFVCQPEQHWNIDWFPKLQVLEIENCPELLSLPPIPWTKTLCSVSIRGVMLLQKLIYSNSSHGVRLDIVGKDDPHSLDLVLAFNNLTELEELALVKCRPPELKHLVMLTSSKTLTAESSDHLAEPLGGQGDVKWQLPVEHIEVQELCGNSGKELTEFLTHFPRLSKLEITECGKITHLAVGVDLQQTTSATSEVEKDEVPPAAAELEKEEDGVLLFPPHLSNTLRELVISHCPELVLVGPPTLLPDGGGWLQALGCLQRLKLKNTPKFLSAYLFSSPSCCHFPSSLQFLELNGVEGMGTVEVLSNLTSLTLLELRNCGEDLRCKGLGPLLTVGGQLSALIVYGSPRFFAAWDPNPREDLVTPSSSKLQKLWTDDVVGLLAAPICSFLSLSLTQLQLSGTKEMECFSREQEDALQLLTSVRELEFFGFDKLQHLPTGLHKLTCLKGLQVGRCPSVRSLPKDGLPSSLEKVDVLDCGNEELIQQCRWLVGTISEIRL